MSSEALAEQLLECSSLPNYVSKIIGYDKESSDPRLSPYEILKAHLLPSVRKPAPPRPTSSPIRTLTKTEEVATLHV